MPVMELVDIGGLVRRASMGPVSFNTGNQACRLPTKPSDKCFNGAGVFQHRKRDREFSKLVRLANASMGPVSFNTGNAVNHTVDLRVNRGSGDERATVQLQNFLDLYLSDISASEANLH